MHTLPNIHTAVNVLQSTFSKDFPRMDFLFTYRRGSSRNVVNVIRSLPGVLLTVLDDISPDISFESTWVNDPQVRQKPQVPISQTVGWQAIDASLRSQRPNYLAHSFIVSRKAREIAIFDYGFEIRAADNFEILGVKSIAWNDPSTTYLHSIVGTEFRGLSLSPNADAELKHRWVHPTLADKIRKADAKKKQFISVGQASRELLMDDVV